MPSSNAIASLLAIKPAQRSAQVVDQLVSFLSVQPFFAGVSTASLELLSACLVVQRAAPGEVVLHVGELTDRMYLLLSGGCSVIRHSRREGFQRPPPQLFKPGQTLCEASLVQSGRKSDVAVTAAAAAAAAVEQMKNSGDGGDGGDGGGGGGENGGVDGEASGAVFAVITRAAWSNMCARAPLKPEYGEARLAMLCCCVRSLAASDPAHRTLEQAEDLAALLRLLPGLSHTSAPVLRAMSEAAYLRQLPPGTIMFEECTRAEAEFLVLFGTVETHNRPKRQGAANRAALRSALRSAVAAARVKSAKGGPKTAGAAAAEGPPKTIRQKIEEERRAREEIKQSLALQREGLRTPPPRGQPGRPTGAKAVEEEFKKWMLEFLSRKRSGDSPATAAPGAAAERGNAAAKTAAAAAKGPEPKTASAWRRAAYKATHASDGAKDGEEGEEGSLAALKRSDTTLMEYERRKAEEATGVREVGNLLGGAAARKAYIRGITRDTGSYGEQDDMLNGIDSKDDEQRAKGGVHWGTAATTAGAAASLELDVEDVDEEEADPWVRLTCLDRRYRVVQKAIKYIDAVEKVMGISKESKPAQDAGGAAAAGHSPWNQGAGGAPRPSNPDEGSTPDDIHLLLLSGNEEAAGDGDAAAAAGSDDEAIIGKDLHAGAAAPAAKILGSSGGGGGAQGVAAAAPGAAATGPGPDDEVDDACDEHFEQLYGPLGERVEQGHVAGELPAAVLDRNARGAQRPRRAHSAIAGPSGSDVLVVALETLRRGHDAARDDLVSERLAMLTALEPLRGLSDEHQAQLALGCTVAAFDANHIIVRQGQPVDALYVVLEGEVRLLDDPDNPGCTALSPTGAAAAAGAAPATSPTPPPPQVGAAAGAGPESPFRTHPAPTKMLSIKTRRAAASLSALTLLGPGGSFGESVLGYPEDLAAGTAAGWTVQGRGTDDGEASLPISHYLATAMTSRTTKLLVLTWSLLSKYGYLRTSLPPFADLRREAINGRRQQLKVSLQNRPVVAGLSVGTQQHQQSQSGAAAGGDGGGGSGATSPAQLQLPTLSSPTAAAAAAHAAALGGSGAYQTPRPPPIRPAEVLEQLGFKPVLRRIYNGLSKPAGAGPPAATASASSSPAPGASLPAAAAAAPAVPDRHRRQDLLAASSLAFNAPQSLANAVARARGDGNQPAPANAPAVMPSAASTSLPFVPGHLSIPPRRASADGTSGVRSPGNAAVAAVLGGPKSSPTGYVSGFALPAPFQSGGGGGGGGGGQQGSRLALQNRVLRMSTSGLGNAAAAAAAAGGGAAADSPGTSPARRSSLSGIAMGPTSNGGSGSAAGSLTSGGGGGGSGANPSPQRGVAVGGGGRLRIGLTAAAAAAGHDSAAPVVLPRLSMPGNLGGITGVGARPVARASVAGTEPFLARLDGGEGSPRSFSPQHSGLRAGGRSGSTGSFVAVGAPGAPPSPVPLLPQRLGQNVARA